MGDVDPNQLVYLGDRLRVQNHEYWSLHGLISNLRKTYCGSVGIEYTHIENADEVTWLESKIEGDYGPRGWTTTDTVEQRHNLKILQKTHQTALYLGKRFPGAKVFGIDGCEALCTGAHNFPPHHTENHRKKSRSLFPSYRLSFRLRSFTGLWSILRRSSELGVEDVEMGMAHRGRVNVLNTVFEKSLSSICNQFNENEFNITDVKYHLGISCFCDAHHFASLPRPALLFTPIYPHLFDDRNKCGSGGGEQRSTTKDASRPSRQSFPP